jgi:hypothetical protein
VAKLKARGRKEVFRVERTRASSSPGVAEVLDYRALMSDGNILERMVLHYTPEETARNYGKKSHDYGWKVRGRARSGLTLEQLLKLYLDKGWQLSAASGDYFTVGGDSIEAHSQEPFVAAEAAAKRREGLARTREKEASRQETRARESDGPGFYVTNGYTGSPLRRRVADHPKPFPRYEQAEEFAVGKLRYFLGLSLDYLLPVLVVSARSRQDAESGRGDVLWEDGKSTGPTVDPRQESLF